MPGSFVTLPVTSSQQLSAIGPFTCGAKLYAFACAIDGDGALGAFESLDNGSTWSHLTDQPAIGPGSYFRYGNLLTILGARLFFDLIPPGYAYASRLFDFDLSTGEWTGNYGEVDRTSAQGPGFGRGQPYRRADGSILHLYGTTKTFPNTKICYGRYASGAWDLDHLFADDFTSQSIVGTAYDPSNDDLYVFYAASAGGNYWRVLHADNSIGPMTALCSDYFTCDNTVVWGGKVYAFGCRPAYPSSWQNSQGAFVADLSGSPPVFSWSEIYRQTSPTVYAYMSARGEVALGNNAVVAFFYEYDADYNKRLYSALTTDGVAWTAQIPAFEYPASPAVAYPLTAYPLTATTSGCFSDDYSAHVSRFYIAANPSITPSRSARYYAY